ncbi:MAG TPA: hypothetical protein VK187_06650 [Geobacteraceae bacterium]|nr:hypothetical protein [Geobacteraceae bacterium]
MSRKFTMVHVLATALVPAALTLGASAACAGNVGVDLNLHLGNQPQQVVVPAPVIVQQAPVVVQQAPIFSIEQDVNFVYPAQLGFFVAVGVPYDLFYVQNSYYLCRDGRWFRAPGSHGPWAAAQYSELPPGLRRHKLERIRQYRRAEYDVYRRDRDHYHGKHFMTGKDEWKAYRKEEKEYRKEAKHEEKDYRKEMKRAEKEERKQHRGGKHDND